MLRLVRCNFFLTVLAVCLPISAVAETSAKDFIKAQAAKAAFVSDVQKLEEFGANIFRFETLALLRMTHTEWSVPEQNYMDARGVEYSYFIDAAAEINDYDFVQTQRALRRNMAVGEEHRVISEDLIELVQDMIERAPLMSDKIDEGDPILAGAYYYDEIQPVWTALRRGVVSLSGIVSKEIRLDALKFKP